METQLHYRNLGNLFVESVNRAGLADKVLLDVIRTHRCESLTFGQLDERARRFALWLVESAEIGVGDKVALLSKNRVDWDVAFWGIILAGAIPVLIDPERLVAGVVEHIEHTDSRIVVMADDYRDEKSREDVRKFACERGLGFLEMVETPFCDSLGLVDDVLGTIRDAAQLEGVAGRIGLDDIAVILCTSGTTGDPREVELTHRNLLANIQGTVDKVEISEKDRVGHILPPHHSFGMTVGKILPVCVGAYSLYTNQYRQVAELIRDKGITIFIAVPALYSVLAKAMEDGIEKEKSHKRRVRLFDKHAPKLVGRAIVKKLGWKKLRFCLSGSAAMPTWVLDAFWKRGLLLYEGYGTTENSPVYGFNDKRSKLGSVGKPINTLSVKIVDDELRELPAFEKGQIALGGPCIMEGYYKNPRATKAAVWTDNEGVRWLQTGDLGYLDDEGNLFITGRKKYLIVLPGGKNVNPELVEAALLESRFVAEVLVVPHGQESKEEAVKAIVRPAMDTIRNHAEFSSEDLAGQPHVLKKIVWQSIHECQQKSCRLSSYEKISSRHLEIRIEEFEKTSTGKIKRDLYMNT